MTAIELAHIDQGPKDGKPLVLLHGFPFHHGMWQAQTAFLTAKGYRVIAPDLRGMGHSPVPKEPSTMERHSADVFHLLDRLRVDRFVLVGFSLGGYVALQMAHEQPKRLRGLCLIDTRAEPDDEAAKKGRRGFIEKIRSQGALALVETMGPKVLTERTRTQKQDLYDAVTQMMRATLPEGAVRALEGMMERPDQVPNLPKIACPTLVVVGAEDPITPIPMSQTLQKHIPNAQLRIITGASHLAPMEAPEPVNHFLEDWLKNLDSSKMPQTGIQRLKLKVEGPAKDLH